MRLSSSSRRQRLRWVAVGLLAVATLAARPAAACPGDCGRDGSVTVDEIVTALAIAIGNQPVTACAAADRDEDGEVRVDELVAAIDAALRGCAAAFTEVSQAAGVDFGGLPATSAAAGDYDGDGWIDLIVVDRRTRGSLYRNRGDGTFVDATDAAGLELPELGAVGPAWGDIDNDGDLDLYLTANGEDERRFYLFVNDGDGGFREEGIERGAAVATEFEHRGMSVTFGDYDRDGYLDIHTTEWSGSLAGLEGAESHARLLRNRGAEQPGYFDDVTVAAGVVLDADPFGSSELVVPLSFASRFVDLDDDGWPDLAVTSDFGTSRLFWNQGDGTFLDGTEAAGVGTDENGMGSAIGDFDSDGRLDWFVTSIFETDPRCLSSPFVCGWGTTGNRLYRNLGGRRFEDATDAAGVRNGFWGWGAAFFDFDNDRDLDLIMTNGTLDEAPANSPFRTDPMRLWENRNGVMSEISERAGTTSTAAGKGLLVFDYDRDGDLDVYIGNDDAPPLLFRNERGNERDWLRVVVEGTTSNRQGLGARVTVRMQGQERVQVREIDAGSHFLGQSETTAHFGLGNAPATGIEVRVQWPVRGREVVFRDVEPNTSLLAVEPTE